MLSKSKGLNNTKIRHLLNRGEGITIYFDILTNILKFTDDFKPPPGMYSQKMLYLVGPNLILTLL